MISTNVLKQARIFCSCQPCPNEAQGDFVLEVRGVEERFPVCDEHREVLMTGNLATLFGLE